MDDVQDVQELSGQILRLHRPGESASRLPGASIVTVPLLTKEQGGLVPSDLEAAQWQWEHRKGFRDYLPLDSDRLEAAFRRGDFRSRLRSGKREETPMEVFFDDMIQYALKTGNMRRIRRIGRTSWSDMLHRRLKTFSHVWKYSGPEHATNSSSLERRRREIAIAVGQGRTAGLLTSGGMCAAMARSQLFFVASMLAVLANSLWMGVQADSSHADTTFGGAGGAGQIVDHIFCALFSLELIVRFFAYRRTWDCLCDTWFVLDALLVCLGVLETWLTPLAFGIVGKQSGSASYREFAILRLVRITRLTRLMRMVRLLRVLPEVMILLKGIAAAARSLFFTVLLLLVLLFLFSVVLRTQSSDSSSLKAMFSSIPSSMWILLLDGILMDGPADRLNAIGEESNAMSCIVLLFIFLSLHTVLNMLIGILCDVVKNIAAAEKDRLAVHYLQSNVLEILHSHDRDNDRHIHKSEFELLMQNPEMHLVLTRFGVNVSDLASLKDVLFEDAQAVEDDSDSEADTDGKPFCPPKLSFVDFLELVLRLRGGNAAMVTDVVQFREYFQERCLFYEDTLERQRTQAAEFEILADPTLQSPLAESQELPAEVASCLEDVCCMQRLLAEQQAAWQEQAVTRQRHLAAEVQRLNEQLCQLQQLCPCAKK